jgi:dUTP pyrophosphatase
MELSLLMFLGSIFICCFVVSFAVMFLKFKVDKLGDVFECHARVLEQGIKGVQDDFEFFADLKVCPDHKQVKIPTRAHDSDAGYDVFAPEDVIVMPGEDLLVPLNWSCSFNPGWAMIFKDKSGVATKNKLAVCSGVIDSAYRGTVTVHFRNENREPVRLTEGQKIAQFMMVPVSTEQPQVVASLDETERGTGGFGSTGTH